MVQFPLRLRVHLLMGPMLIVMIWPVIKHVQLILMTTNLTLLMGLRFI